ncbi:MAG: hypothetical protein R3280_04995 [Marinobacter sp.]|uniref:hypothetical protein n=1 Tax=Marinobacter sp. TaxID=50741 RepID=UPI00299DB3EC|nr:hypothetical protein [Marinobacter sp.]MDX1633968.1 hypothetical protein [Marinobacter sp.]
MTLLARFRPAVVLVLLFATATLARAEALTELQIESFIASLKELHTLEADFEAAAPEVENGDPASLPRMDTLISDSIARMEGHVLYDQVEQVVRQHGFEGVEQWSRIGDRILNAFVARQMGAQDKDLRKEMEQALAQIENNPNLTAAQKEQMKSMMGGAVSSVEAMANAPQEDVRAIEPYMQQLDRTLTDEGSQ